VLGPVEPDDVDDEDEDDEEPSLGADSFVPDAAPSPFESDFESLVESEPVDEPDDEPDEEREPAPDPPRSFFAQPEPLKWIVGGANSLRIVPSRPHDGQKWGPGSLIPRRMSVRWSQALQAYS